MTPPRNPFPTVDIIIEVEGGIVLIERKNPPHGWALPGGFVDVGECLEQAAVREAAEEISLDVRLTLLPDLARPQLKGRVLERSPQPDAEWAHVEFSDITDADRQSLARHVLRVQARKRQQRQQD